MRDIEFRVWDKKEKYMFKLDNDDFFINNNGLQKRHYVAYLGDGYVNATDRYILMQYTGLKDKNGVKIFEQDIIKNDPGKIAVVEFGMGKFFARCSCGMEYQNCDFSQTEIIGNIYENPELLEIK
jgi:uncharacterized phage protein (TIGR01671 family)